MDLRLVILCSCVLLVVSAPTKEQKKEVVDDLKVAEGRQHVQVRNSDYSSSYSAPGPLHAPSSYAYNAPRVDYAPSSRGGYGGGARVTSYNRRGHSSELGYSAPRSESYGGHQQQAPSSDYSEPRDYAHAEPAPAYAIPPSSYNRARIEYLKPIRGDRYGDYGPPNHFSSHSQQLSHDPSYDPAKDPVSQYADYVPVREYGHHQAKTDNQALSLYGYK